MYKWLFSFFVGVMLVDPALGQAPPYSWEAQVSVLMRIDPRFTKSPPSLNGSNVSYFPYRGESKVVTTPLNRTGLWAPSHTHTTHPIWY